MAEELIDMLAGKVRAARKKRAGEILSSVGAMTEASARAERTGASPGDIYRSLLAEGGQDAGTITEAQRVEALQKQSAALQKMDEAEIKQYYDNLNKQLDALKAKLTSATTVRGQQSTASSARANNIRRALIKNINIIQGNVKRRRGVDAQTRKEVELGLKGFNQLGQEQVQEDVNTILTMMPGEPEFLEAQARLGQDQADPDLLKQKLSEMDAKGMRDLVSRRAASIMQGDTPQALAERSAVMARLAAADIPLDQKVAQARQLAARFGMSPEEVMPTTQVLGEDGTPQELTYAQAEGLATEDVARDAQLLEQNTKELLRQAGRIGASSEQVNSIMREIDQVVMALNASPGQVRARLRTSQPSPEDYQQRMVGARNPRERAEAMMSYIRDLPTDRTAQQMKFDLMQTPEYQSWKKSRNYDRFDDDMVYKEFDREMRQSQKRRRTRFKDQVELNRQQGIGVRQPSIAVPEVQTSASADMVAGSDREQETLDGQPERPKRD